jgi:hypothetical protein
MATDIEKAAALVRSGVLPRTAGVPLPEVLT